VALTKEYVPAAHSSNVLPPSSEPHAYPEGHFPQAAAPVFAWCWPAAQLVHAVLPSPSEYFPAAQFEQDTAPLAEYFPAAQGELPFLADGQELPWGHWSHTSWAVLSWYHPAAQSVHEPTPAVSEYLPAAHAAQLEPAE